MSQVYIKRYEKEIPILVTPRILQVKTREFLEKTISKKIYKKIIDSYLKTIINGHLTSLVSNNLIKKDEFWNLILKIYGDLIKNLNKTSPMSKYSKLIIKGGNVLEFIYNNFIDILEKQFNQDQVNIFRENTGTYFKKSDIDFALIIDYNKILRKYNIESFNQKLDIFKSRCLDTFERYKAELYQYLNPLTTELSREFIIQLNDDISDMANLILEVYDDMSSKTKKQHSYVKEIILYLREYKHYSNIYLSYRQESPPDSIISPVNVKTMKRDVIIERIPNKTHYTNFYWQDNKRVTFFTTHNKLMIGYMSPEIINKLYYSRSDFSLLRLLLNFDLENRDHHLESDVRGEFIDLSISLPGDYWGKSMNLDPTNIVVYNDRGKLFFANSNNYLIRELIKILFGVEGDNVDLLTAHKFTKRLNRLFFLIFMDLITRYDYNEVLPILYYLKDKITNQPPSSYVSFSLQDKLRFGLEIDQEIDRETDRETDQETDQTLLIPPDIRRQSSNIYKQTNNNETIRYLESRDSRIDSVLLNDENPLYFFFETMFRIFSRTIESDSDLIEKEDIIINCFVNIVNNFIQLIKN